MDCLPQHGRDKFFVKGLNLPIPISEPVKGNISFGFKHKITRGWGVVFVARGKTKGEVLSWEEITRGSVFVARKEYRGV